MAKAKYNANERTRLLADRMVKSISQGMSAGKARDEANRWYYYSYVDPMTIPDEQYYLEYGKYKPSAGSQKSNVLLTSATNKEYPVSARSIPYTQKSSRRSIMGKSKYLGIIVVGAIVYYFIRKGKNGL